MKILLATTNQFGFLVDYHRYYIYLKKNNHEVKYICYDYGKEKVEKDNPDIIYVSHKGNKLLRHFRFINSIIAFEKKQNFDRIMIHVFPMVTLLLLYIKRNKVFIDIRTLSVHKKKYKRAFFDFLIRIASIFYKHTSVITDVAAEHIGIRKYKLLPLGGAYFGNEELNGHGEQYNDILHSGDFIFLYVGTLFKRRIIECVQGFHSYINSHPNTASRFVIIGTSLGNELNELNAYIETHNLKSVVHTLGYIPQSRLAPFFKYAGCGIAFTPLTMPFLLQPTTKAYEYLINGIPVIATASQDNIRLLEAAKTPSGIIISDSPAGIEEAVGKILAGKESFVTEAIKKEFYRYEWDNLLHIYLEEALLLPRKLEQGA